MMLAKSPLYDRRDVASAPSHHADFPTGLAEAMNGGWHITVAESFEELRQRWPALNQLAGGSLFSTLAWFETLARSGFDSRERLRLLVAENPAQNTAFCLPMAEGKTLHGLSNFYSSLYEPIGSLPDEPENLLQKAFQAIGHAAGLIDLRPLDADGPLLPAMLAALRASGYWADTYFCFSNWVLDVEGRNFESYFEQRPAQLRNTVRRGHGKLDREGSWAVSIYTGGESGLEAAIDAFESVYARSWKEPEPFPRFIAELCRTAAKQGWLRLGVLRLGDMPIAAQLWLVHDKAAYIYKLAYDDHYRRLSAGSVLTAALMRHVIDVDGVTLVDYLTGDEPYKRDWMSRRRERLGIIAFRPTTLTGLLAAGRHYLGKISRHLHSRG